MKDEVLGRMFKKLEKQGGMISGFTLQHDCLLYKGRVIIPHSSNIVHKLLLEYHTTALGGHNGEYKTYLRGLVLGGHEKVGDPVC